MAAFSDATATLTIIGVVCRITMGIYPADFAADFMGITWMFRTVAAALLTEYDLVCWDGQTTKPIDANELWGISPRWLACFREIEIITRASRLTAELGFG